MSPRVRDEGSGEQAAEDFTRPLAVTFFQDAGASTKSEVSTTLLALADKIRDTRASEKAKLPWLKLARFGNDRTDKGSLRHDRNVMSISGIEADYDAGTMNFEDAAERLLKAGILSLIYTSPRHCAEAPRWRVLCPTSVELDPGQRQWMLGRLNGILHGIISQESWTLSQSYYFGRVNQNPLHQVRLVEGCHIDLLDHLDEGWWGKNKSEAGPAQGSNAGYQLLNERELLEEIVSGRGYHVPCVRLLGRWARDGTPMMVARERLISAMEAVPAAERDERWQARRSDLDRCLDDIYVKEAAARDNGLRPARRSEPGSAKEEGWPEPVDFLGEQEITGIPEIRPEHLPEALYPFVKDTAERMGVDPAAVGLGAVVSCASVIHEDWRVQPKRYDDTWTERARLWGAIVGDPSILKSPIVAACTRSIEQLEAAARDKHSDAMRAYRTDLTAWKKAEVSTGPMPVPPRLDRYLVESTTVEALSEVLREDEDAKHHAPLGRVLLRQNELAEWLATFDRYRSGGRGGADRGAYLRLYNGGRHTVDRVTRGSFTVPNWSACVLGGIQPEPIRRIAREADDDGLLQRFVYCVPISKEPGQDRRPNASAIERYDSLMTTLAGLSPPALASALREGVDRSASPIVLDEGAHRQRHAIEELARAMGNLPDTSNRLRAAFGKWPGLFARIALVFHMINYADALCRCATPPEVHVVIEETARRVAAYMREVLLPHLIRAEALMFSSVMTGHARWIAGYILSRSLVRLSLRDVVQAYHPLRDPEHRRELLDVMDSLVTMEWLKPEPSPNPARPPSMWLVNPAVHTSFAARAAQERERREQARTQITAPLRSRRAGA